MATSVAWADQPRQSQSMHLPITQGVDGEDDEGFRGGRHHISVDGDTYQIFAELMRKAGFSNEAKFLNFLMTTAMAKIHDLKSAALRATKTLLKVESQRLGISMDTVENLIVPEDSSKSPASHVFQQFESKAAEYSMLVQQVRLEQQTEPELTSNGITVTVDHPPIPPIESTTAETQPIADSDQPLLDNDDQHVCSRCGRDRMTSEELEDHSKHCNILDKYKRIRRPPPPRYILCSQCGMRFSDTVDYKKHYNQYHTNHPALYACEFCNKKQAFTDKRGLHKHKKMEPVCQECRRRYGSVDMLNLHLKNKNHDKEKRQQVKSAKASSKKGCGHPTVLPALEAVNEAPPDSLPSGYSFMSVKLNPMHKLSGTDERLVMVPHTANRDGYVLKAEYLNPPYPVPPIETRATNNRDSEEAYEEEEESQNN